MKDGSFMMTLLGLGVVGLLGYYLIKKMGVGSVAAQPSGMAVNIPMAKPVPEGYGAGSSVGGDGYGMWNFLGEAVKGAGGLLGGYSASNEDYGFDPYDDEYY